MLESMPAQKTIEEKKSSEGSSYDTEMISKIKSVLVELVFIHLLMLWNYMVHQMLGELHGLSNAGGITWSIK